MYVKIIISIIPTIAYMIFRLWANRLINSKVTDAGNRKKYKKYFNSLMGDLFAPFFFLSFILATILFPKSDTWVTFGIIILVLKFITMIVSGAVSRYALIGIRKGINKLRNESIESIMKDVDKKS